MNSNSKNPEIGKKFQMVTANLLSKYYDKEFIPEIALNIGNPPKAHKFDLVSKDKSVVVECKCYSWTAGKNSPSAKLSTLNEAVLYLKLLTGFCVKVIVMTKVVHPSRNETLAEYYMRRYNFVLEGITLIEVDVDNQVIRVIKE